MSAVLREIADHLANPRYDPDRIVCARALRTAAEEIDLLTNDYLRLTSERFLAANTAALKEAGLA